MSAATADDAVGDRWPRERAPSWASLAIVDNTVAFTSCTAIRAAIAIAVCWIGSISRLNTSIVGLLARHHLGQRIVGEHDHQIDVTVVE